MNRCRFEHIALALVAVISGIGCGDEPPVDMTGVYALNLTTSATNDCMVENWMPGRSNTNVAFSLMQSPSDRSLVTGRIENPLVALAVRLWLGTADFTGSAKGSALELKTLGGNAMREGTCSYTRVAYVSASLRGDTLDGVIRYQFDTNGDPACGFRNSCRSVQNFNGLRPPKP